MKIIINQTGMGVNLSDEAFRELIKGGWRVTKMDKYWISEDEEAEIGEFDQEVSNDFGHTYAFTLYFRRNRKFEELWNPDIVRIVEQLGSKANGSGASLRVIEIPDEKKWYIDYKYQGPEKNLSTIYESVVVLD